jgi:hypothetical protein
MAYFNNELIGEVAVWDRLLRLRLPVTVTLLVIVMAVIIYFLCVTDFGGSQRAGTLVNLLYTALTGILVLVAIAQVRNAQSATKTSLDDGVEQRRKWATLQVCDRYDMDAEITSAVRFLRRYHPFGESRLKVPQIRSAGTEGGDVVRAVTTDPAWLGLSDDHRYTMSAGLLLNYFDSIAIGIDQKFYDENICTAHIGGILKSWMAMLRNANPETFEEVMNAHYPHTKALHARWNK